jgi:hypothetical protein
MPSNFPRISLKTKKSGPHKVTHFFDAPKPGIGVFAVEAWAFRSAKNELLTVASVRMARLLAQSF